MVADGWTDSSRWTDRQMVADGWTASQTDGCVHTSLLVTVSMMVPKLAMVSILTDLQDGSERWWGEVVGRGGE